MRRTDRFNNIVNQLLGLDDLVLCIGHDQTVEILLLVAGVSSVRAALAFLDGALATNSNLGTGVSLHFLQCVTTGSDK